MHGEDIIDLESPFRLNDALGKLSNGFGQEKIVFFFFFVR